MNMWLFRCPIATNVAIKGILLETATLMAHPQYIILPPGGFAHNLDKVNQQAFDQELLKHMIKD